MSGRHLGERIHDLLDNRLPADAAAEAMAHLEECAECGHRWQELRAARDALSTSEAGIDVTFARRLLDREHMAQVASHETRRDARAARGHAHRPVYMATSLGLVLIAVVGAAYVAGEPDDIDPGISASAETGMLSVARMDSSTMRGWVPTDGWIHPDWQSSGFEPVEAAVRETSQGVRVLSYTLLTGDEEILVVEQLGRLAADQVAHLPRTAVDGLDGYVVGTEPSQIVWQTGDVVVLLTGDCAVEHLEGVAATFPQDDEHELVDQVMAGFAVFGDALTGR